VARWFAADADNLQAAVRWAIETADSELGLRLATALGPYWRFEGRIVERRSTIVALLDLPGAEVPSQGRMRALEAAGSLFYYSGENDRADGLYRAQLEVARTLDDRQGVADATFNLAWTEDWRDRPAEASRRLDELVEAYRELGDERPLARTEVLHAGLLLQSDPVQARRILEAAHAHFRALDDVIYEAMAASMIGGAYLMEGDRKAAARWFVEVLVVAREITDRPAVISLLPIEAVAALELGRPEAAAVILGAFDTLSRRYGVQPPVGLAQTLNVLDPRGRAQAALDSEAFDAAARRGGEMTMAEAVAYVLEMARPLM
jgi:tetratricopeptide (TPR) repeat protein